MKRILKTLVYGALVVILVIATTVVVHSIVPLKPTIEIRYVDLISITLTALAIMITVLGLFVASLGVIGWATFEAKLRDNSLNYLAAELSKDGKLRKEFETILTEMSLQGVRPNGDTQAIQDQSGNPVERPYND